MQTGRRAWKSELSTIDSAFLLAGILTAGTYFDRDTPEEREIRNLADALYLRAVSYTHLDVYKRQACRLVIEPAAIRRDF